tara:strand:- start:4897 stop:5847 length:951 start_codon:yes stop_codon:yes gene_type:complete
MMIERLPIWASAASTICVLILSSGPLAAEEFVINPFNAREMRALDWKRFPTPQNLKGLQAYTGTQNKDGNWYFEYEKKVSSSYGEVTHRIMSYKDKIKKTYAYSILYLDNNVKDKCNNISAKIHKGLGVDSISIDRGYNTNMLISNKSKKTMDWYFYDHVEQWRINNTSVNFSCFGFGPDKESAKKNGSVIIRAESSKYASKVVPITWLLCAVNSKIVFADGEERKIPQKKWVFGVDHERTAILRSDNSRIDRKAVIDDQRIKFNFKFSKIRAVPFVIDRYTGVISASENINKDGISYRYSASGDCEKRAKLKKKF